MRNFIKILSLFISCSILPACAGIKDAGIETGPLVEGESIIIKFDAPFEYTYFTEKGGAVVRKVENEETLLLKNTYAEKGAPIISLMSVLHFKIESNKNLKLFFGPDPAYATALTLPGEMLKIFCGVTISQYSDCVKLYNSKVSFINMNREEEGKLDSSLPISFSQKPYEVRTIRKEAFCVDEKTKEIKAEAGKTPQLDCDTVFGSGEISYTGKMIETDYNIDYLIASLKENKHSIIATENVKDVSIPIRIVLKNTNYATNNAVEKPTQNIALQSTSINSSKSNSVNAESGGKGSCSLSQSNAPQSISGLLFLSILPSLMWVALRKVTSSHPSNFSKS